MSRFSGFIGPSYTSRAIASDAETCINFYPEAVGSQGGADNSPTILLSKPGLGFFASLPGAASVQAILNVNGRCFAVGGGAFWEVFANGNVTKRGTVAGDTRPQLSANQTQVLILAGGMGFIFTLATNVFGVVTSSGWPQGADKLAFLDGYFIALESPGQTFAISSVNDGTKWAALDFGTAQGQQGNMVTMICDQRQVWFQADSHTEIYYDSGAASFPIVRLSGAFMDQGSIAIDGGCKADNAIMWLGQNTDGAGVVWRTNGYTPQRVSTHAVEAALQSYPLLSDAVSYCYQDGGHTFFVMTLPSANGGLGVTWVYDIASGFWHQRGWWNASLSMYQADLARCHAFCFGQHLVGDYQSGTLYTMSQSIYTDNGTLIRRERTAPDLANGGEWNFYPELTLTLQSGVGLDGAGLRNANAPMTLVSPVGLVPNNVAIVPGRGGYFAAGSGTSESEFLLALGALNVYQAFGMPAALTLGNEVLAGVPLLYRNGPALLVPNPVTATNIFAPHWLFACQTPVLSATVHYNNLVSFTSGVAIIPDTVAPVRYVFQVASPVYTLIYPSPYSPLATGTSYAVASYSYNSTAAATTITLTTAYTGTLAVLFSALDGPTIPVAGLYEAWPDWRPLATGEIDAACDTFNWALRAFQAAYAVTSQPVYQQAATATIQQAAIVYNINDSRDWLKPTYQLQPFAQSGSFSFTNVTPAPVFQCDAAGDVQIVFPATTAGQTQYGIASINDVYASGNTTQIWIGSTIAQSIQVYIDTTNQSPYVAANRYLATITLPAGPIALYTLPLTSFKNSTAATLPVNSVVYTFGFLDIVQTAHTLTLQRVRQLPNLTIPYIAGAIPFTANFLGTPASLIGWRGPVYSGYQSPSTFKRMGNEAGVTANVQFLSDSQAAWTAQASTHDAGPFAPVFIFNRADAVQYGPANTWAWSGPDPNAGWCGYQYRPLAELAECIAQCAGTESYYANAVVVCNRFLTWTDSFWSNALTGPPTDFPITGAQNNYQEVHIPALILRAVLYMASKFGMTATYTSLMSKCQAFWVSQYQLTGAMAGTFCTNLLANGVFGFQTGEILRTLAQWYTWANANAQPAMAVQAQTWATGLVTYALDASGNVGGVGTNPQISLLCSNDGGRTWGNERSISMGALGQTQQKVSWRRLGRSRDRAFRVVCSEPVFVALIAADLVATQQ